VRLGLLGKALFSILVLALSACAPAAPVPVRPTQAVAQATASPASSQAPSLSSSDETVFTIANDEPFSGREGDARPDWLGWGAGAMDVAPDGSFWIADTAATPQRLLHYTIHGVQVDEISLRDVATSVYDLAVEDDLIWLLDLNAGDIRVIGLIPETHEVRGISVPVELYSSGGTPIANGIFSLHKGADGSLIVSGITGLTRLLDASGRMVNAPIPGFSAYGRVYGTQPGPDGQPPDLTIDGRPVTLGSSQFLEAEPFLGFNPDGSFPVVVRRERPGPGENGELALDWLIAYFRPDGTVRGYAGLPLRMPWQEFNHELAMGPNGQIFDLVSLEDHSVQVVKLGFAPSPPGSRPFSPTATSTPLVPIRSDSLPPLGTIPADAVQAERALVEFFSDLSRGRFQTASQLFGGSYDALGAGEPEGDEAAIESAWTRICQQYLCLPVAGITRAEQTGPGEFTFDVVFMWPDGQRLEIGACCGENPAAAPPVWQFVYTVTLENGSWRVMRGPLYVP
jgi:hypothetical protein